MKLENIILTVTMWLCFAAAAVSAALAFGSMTYHTTQGQYQTAILMAFIGSAFGLIVIAYMIAMWKGAK